MTIHCFGDSWGAGAELRPNEHPFIHWMAKTLSNPYVNYSKEGSSLGLILYTLIDNIKFITPDDTVVVVVPPDTRWYDENSSGFYSVQTFQRDDYFKFLNNKTLRWFTYHHALFVYSIEKILNDIGCKYVLAHNYGQISDYKQYNLQIDYSKFLSDKSLTDLLSGHQMLWKSYPDHLPPWRLFDEDGPPVTEFSGVYFAGCKSHPNELGHQKIAELLINKLYDNRV